MIQSSWLWVAPSWADSCPWATFRPDTDATTATRAMHTEMRIWLRRRGSVTAVSGDPRSGSRELMSLLVLRAVVALMASLLPGLSVPVRYRIVVLFDGSS